MIVVAAGFLSLAGLVGGAAAVATAVPTPQHDTPQAQWEEGPQATVVEYGVLAAPDNIYSGAQPNNKYAG